MAQKMKAAVVHRFREPLRLEEVPVPQPGEGEILIKVEASGVCHTTLHAASDDWPVKSVPMKSLDNQRFGARVSVRHEVAFPFVADPGVTPLEGAR